MSCREREGGGDTHARCGTGDDLALVEDVPDLMASRNVTPPAPPVDPATATTSTTLAVSATAATAGSATASAAVIAGSREADDFRASLLPASISAAPITRPWFFNASVRGWR